MQPFYLLALQRWGEFLELASFLWIFLCGVCFFVGCIFFVGSGKWWWVWGIYIMYRGLEILYTRK